MSVLIRSVIVTLPNSFNFYFYRQTDNPFSPLIFFFPIGEPKKKKKPNQNKKRNVISNCQQYFYNNFRGGKKFNLSGEFKISN